MDRLGHYARRRDRRGVRGMALVPRAVGILGYLGLVGTAAILLEIGTGRPYETTTSRDANLSALVQLCVGYLAGVLIIGAFCFGARMLWLGTWKRPPLWPWFVGAVSACVLVAEQWWIAKMNADRHSWLMVAEDRGQLYLLAHRWFLWGLLDDIAWILLVLAPLALWAVIRAQAEPLPRDGVVRLGVGLFLLGPVAWTLDLWGVLLPLWLLVWLVLTRWLTVARPVLDHVVPGTERTLREQTTADPLPKGVTRHDVMFALGPRTTERDTMVLAAKIGAGIGLVLGTFSLFLWWRTSPVFGADQQDSVLLYYLDTAVWELAKWVFGAAAVGLLWRWLPGRRGPVTELGGRAGQRVGECGIDLQGAFQAGALNWSEYRRFRQR